MEIEVREVFFVFFVESDIILPSQKDQSSEEEGDYGKISSVLLNGLTRSCEQRMSLRRGLDVSDERVRNDDGT